MAELWREPLVMAISAIALRQDGVFVAQLYEHSGRETLINKIVGVAPYDARPLDTFWAGPPFETKYVLVELEIERPCPRLKFFSHIFFENVGERPARANGLIARGLVN